MTSLCAKLNADFKRLTKDKLFITASVHPNFKDQIIIEGIKNLRTTGRFTDEDRDKVNTIINRHLETGNFEFKILANDPCMHNAVITCLED